MSPLFHFDDLTSVKFNIDTADIDLARQIADNGGTLTEGLDNPHFVVGTRACVTVFRHMVPALRREWVTECIREGKMIPIYEYIDEPTENPLQELSLEHRDLAELVRTTALTLEDQAFTILHRRLPHNTSNKWREIYRSSCRATLQAVSQIAPDIAGYTNRAIFQILAFLPVTPPADTWEEENAPHAPVNEQNEGGIEHIGIQSEGDADTDASDPREVVERASEYPDSAQPPTDTVDSSGDEGDEGDDGYTGGDGDSKCADSDTSPLSDPPSPTRVRQPGRGVSFTPKDHKDMVRFVNGLDHKPLEADWETFRSLTENNKVRSAAAWTRQYSKKRKLIQAEVRRLKSQGLSRDE